MGAGRLLRYIAGRLGQAVLVVYIAYTAAFFLLYALPSDPVSLMIGPESGDVSAADKATLAAQYGYDRPIVVQYLDGVFSVLRGDLGFSMQLGQNVSSVLAGALLPTIQLAGLGLAFAVLGGAGVAFASTYFRAPWLRHTLLSLPSLGVSIPAFWFGLLLVQVFSFQLHLVSAFSADGLSSMLLPALTLALPTGAMIAQIFTRSLDDGLESAYADTAKAKGATRARVLFFHASRNALLPVLTITGLVVGQLLSGTVVTETVFSRPGLGRVVATAVSGQDIPIVLGVVLFGAVLYAGTNLVIDLLYPLLDPRQRASTTTRIAAVDAEGVKV